MTWVHLHVPPEYFRRLQGEEQNAAIVAVSCLVLAFFLIVVVPLGLHRNMNNNTAQGRTSGIIVASITVSIIAISTNVLLGWFPSVVMTDPVTRAPVYLFRWCEWAPLGGLMTWLAEAVDLPRNPKEQRGHIFSALIQGLSCFCGFLFPFCTGIVDWTAVMVFSFTTYLMIFPRVIKRYKAFREFVPRSNCVVDKEHYDRLKFAFRLVSTCAVAWTVLIVLYFINMLLYRFASPGYFLGHPALAMMLDTFFDVLAKGFYMNFIVEVHRLVYDPVARTRRQLRELSRLVSVLWDCASEIIVISVTNGGKITTLFSPSFLRLMGEPDYQNALVLETAAREGNIPAYIGCPHSKVLDAYYIKAFEISKGDFACIKRVEDLSGEPSAHHSKQGSKLLCAARRAGLVVDSEHSSDIDYSHQASSYGDCTLQTPEGAEIYCEISANCFADNTVIGVARDMTERHRRAQAERIAHEMLIRQKEAQSINRFTRHEVKNGLLSGIEMVESLKQLQTVTLQAQTSSKAHTKLLNDLAEQLHHTLDTVLAETMARDVIYREYLPKLESAEIEDLIATSTIDSRNPDRFPLNLIPADMPRLHLDPQLIRYIHRNAVSNAVKYGRQGGLVQTVVEYSSEDHELEISVINEPGVGHADLVELGEEASNDVFKQSKRLHKHLDDDINGTLSTGDGAWIMQKCATTLNGECKIHFEPDRTVFSVRFPVEVAWKHDEMSPFCIPDNTWGIAVDDSKIQRKLMGRLLVNSGVDERKVVVLGEKPEEVQSLSSYFLAIFQEHPDAKILVMMDENLDFRVKQNDGESDVTKVLSGSLLASKALSELPPRQEEQMLVLVRSANDAVSEVDLYHSRTHGFFPKAPMRRERILEILAAHWKARFDT